jgi:shikimate dehydrogenase
MIVTGATRLYAIIGDPIAQVRSPQTFSERFAAEGFDALLVPARVPADRFDDAVRGLMALGNLDGLLVTVPFKSRMLPFADHLGDAARCIGAINALRRDADGTWTGDIFDGIGFVRGVERKGARVQGRSVALYGAGGAGSAIAHALASAGAASFQFFDPLPGRAEALASRLQDAFPACRFVAATRMRDDADMLVNASTVGMRPGDRMPADIGPLHGDTLVGDVVITESPTPLIRHAIACGCQWTDGRDMLGGQVDAITAFFSPMLEANAAAGRSSGR